MGLVSPSGRGRRQARAVLAKEERSYLTRKALPGVCAGQGIVLLLEVQVSSGAELNEGHPAPPRRRWGAGQQLL